MPSLNAAKWALVPANQSKMLNKVNMIIERLERESGCQTRPMEEWASDKNEGEDGMAHRGL